MANTKISALTANTNPTWLEELVYAYNNANGKMTLNTMKAFVGWAGITTLNADANIWELTDGIYETTYKLYYKSGEEVPYLYSGSIKQMLFVAAESWWGKAYFVFNTWYRSWVWYVPYASYWCSVSSSEWECDQLASRDWTFKQYVPTALTWECDAIYGREPVQIVSNATGTNTLRPSSSSAPYPWVTYTIYFETVSSSYTVSLWTGITNPFGITLPTSSSKKSIVTVLMTSTTTGIVTWCTIEP